MITIIMNNGYKVIVKGKEQDKMIESTDKHSTTCIADVIDPATNEIMYDVVTSVIAANVSLVIAVKD